MKFLPQPHLYIANNKQEALQILEGKNASLLAGGTNYVPDLRASKINPTLILDISSITGLNYIKEKESSITIGALTSIADLSTSPLINIYGKPLYQACNAFADPLICNRATVGGNLVNASPAADTAVPLLALDATVTLASSHGTRKVLLTEFFLGPNKAAIESNELLLEVEFAKCNTYQGGFMKIGLRKSMAISIITCAVLFKPKTDIRIAYGAVAPKPIRIRKAEEFIRNKEITSAHLEQTIQIIQESINPISDLRASASYRRYLAGVLFKKLMQQCQGN